MTKSSKKINVAKTSKTVLFFWQNYITLAFFECGPTKTPYALTIKFKTIKKNYYTPVTARVDHATLNLSLGNKTIKNNCLTKSILILDFLLANFQLDRVQQKSNNFRY